jgi:drug/metabolite transporter (DMT)-like permease
VALITLLEIVLAPLWVWLTISETPATATLVGGVVLIAAVILQVGGEESSDERPARGDPAAALPPHGR